MMMIAFITKKSGGVPLIEGLCAQVIAHYSHYTFQLHFAFQLAWADYKDRLCPHCLARGTAVLEDELHIICHCPATKVVLEKLTDKVQRLTRLLSLSQLHTR